MVPITFQNGSTTIDVGMVELKAAQQFYEGMPWKSLSDVWWKIVKIDWKPDGNRVTHIHVQPK